MVSTKLCEDCDLVSGIRSSGGPRLRALSGHYSETRRGSARSARGCCTRGCCGSRSFPKTMRRSRTAPLVETEAECCCSGTLTAMPVELPWWQSITFGTTAWRISMGRRQVVESANSALKGAFADLGRGFFRVMGIAKTTVLLGFTLAAYNLDRIRSFKAKHGLDDNGQVVPTPKQTGARRRSGTWTEVIERARLPHRRKYRAVPNQQADLLQVGSRSSRTGPRPPRQRFWGREPPVEGR